MDWTRLPLARAPFDRAAHRREAADLLERSWAEPTTRVLLVHDTELAVLPDRSALDRPAPAELGPLADTGTVLFLGVEDGADVLAVVRDVPDADRTWAPLRDAGHLLGDLDAGLGAAAVGLAQWHARHTRCSTCGTPTEPSHGGWVRRCPADGSEHFPRTDPAVIMAVTDDADRLLLAHNAHWPERRFSTLAGYVEPGESAEQAVAREVGEEVGLRVVDPVYRGSQPWPFPASLMLAYVARAVTTAIQVDAVEVLEARWFTRAELGVAVAAGEVLLPMRTSVARALIEEWYGGELPAGDAPR